jgi:hypothetical protein
MLDTEPSPVKTPVPPEPQKRHGPPPDRPPERGDHGRGHAYGRGHGRGPRPVIPEQLASQPSAVDQPAAASAANVTPEESPPLSEQATAGVDGASSPTPAPTGPAHGGCPPARQADGSGGRPSEHGTGPGRGHGRSGH